MKQHPGWACALLLSACSATPREGVAVGNPGQGLTVQVERSAHVASVQGTLDIAELRALGCDGSTQALLRGVTISASGSTTLPLPADPICGVQLDLAAPVLLQGVFDDERTFELELDVDRVLVESSEPFMNRVALLLVLGPGPWLSPELLGESDDEHFAFGPANPAHDDVAALLADRSFVCEDRDDDGMREEGDRILAWGDDADAEDIPAAPGWQTAP